MYKTRHDWVGKVMHWELCKTLKFDHMNKCICTTQHLPCRMRHTNSSGILRYNFCQTARPYNNQRKKRRRGELTNLWTLLSQLTTKVKLKESEKKNEYQDLAREMKKKMCNMKVTVIPTVIGTLGTVTKGLVKGLEDLEMRGRYWERSEY